MNTWSIAGFARARVDRANPLQQCHVGLQVGEELPLPPGMVASFRNADHAGDHGGVSKAGYYAWVGRPLSAPAQADEVLLRRIRTIHLGLAPGLRLAARPGRIA